jgi:hypothetical protein
MNVRTTRCRLDIAALLAATLLVIIGCAAGGTTAEDRRRLAQLKTDPLLSQVQLEATLVRSSDEAGQRTANAQQNPNRVIRWYETNGSDLREASAKFASLASDAGWSGQLNCHSRGALILASKTIKDWNAHLQIAFSPKGDGTTVSLEISTPHVDGTSGATQPQQAPSGRVQVQASCTS